MDFFEAAQRRRSIRKYSDKKVPAEVIQKALDTALIAPNSSNLQTWQFYWVKSEDKKKKLINACLNQGAASTAQELIVATVRPSLWKKTSEDILKNAIPNGLENKMQQYYGKFIPFIYGWQIFGPIKWLLFNLIGLFKPLPRRPWSLRDREEVCIKSCALACENFMLAIAAQGFDTCPMEGFDEKRVHKILDLKCGDRSVMVISVGERVERGVWGPQHRAPREWFIHEV